MKVLHVYRKHWPEDFTGVNRVVNSIASTLNGKDSSQEVICLSKECEPAIILKDGYKVIRAPRQFDFLSFEGTLSGLSLFKEHFNDADIIHYHFPWPFMDFLQLSLKPKKSIVTYHSDIVRQKHMKVLYKPVMNRFLSSVDHIVATSPNYVSSSEDLSNYHHKTSVIPIGMKDTRFKISIKQTKFAERPYLAEKYALFLGVLRSYKGLKYLVEAASKVDFPIVIAGDGPERPFLERLAKVKNAKNIYFLGEVEEEEKYALLNNCSCFVFPSHLRSEAYGLSLVEAAMFEKPMISCENGTGTSFVNRHNVTGLVVEPANSQSLSGALNTLLSSNEKITEMGRAARRHFEQNLTINSMTDAYEKLYREILI